MENANSKDYLEKIKIQVIENLRQTAHAPSVQMTDVPRTDMLGVADIDDEDAELDDFDEDNNKEVRITKRQRDKHVERDEEFYDSDYERDQTSGPHGQNGQRKRRNITDYKNINSAASDIEMESGIATPEVHEEVVAAATAMVTEANAEVNAEIMEQKALDPPALENAEKAPSNAPSKAESAKVAVEDEDVQMSDVRDEEPSTTAAPTPLETPQTSTTVDADKAEIPSTEAAEKVVGDATSS